MLTKNKLLNLIDCLDAEEKKRFPGWLKNELQGQKQEMWLWFEQIWEGKTEQHAWEYLHSPKSLNQSRINSWNAMLIKWMEDYLAFCALRKDHFARIHFLNRVIIRQNPIHAYPSSIRKSRRYLEQQSVRDKTFYQIQHELDRLDIEFQNSYPGVHIRRYTVDPQQFRQNEEMAILLTNIEVTARRLSYKEPLTEWDHYCIKQLQTYLEKDSAEKWPVAFLYLKIFSFLQPDIIIQADEARNLVEFYQAHLSALRPDAQFMVGILLSNSLIRSYFRQQDQAVIDLVFEIHIWMLTHSKVYEARYLYRNMIHLYLIMARRSQDQETRKKYFDLAYFNLEDLKEKLPVNEREEVYNYNLAAIHFETGNFADLARQIYTLEFKDYTYEINYLILWNKAQYELGEYYGLAERLKNLQISLQQTLKLKPDLRKRQLNQVKYFRKMVNNYRLSILHRLKKQLEEENTILGKKWLMEKLEEKIRLQEKK